MRDKILRKLYETVLDHGALLYLFKPWTELEQTLTALQTERLIRFNEYTGEYELTNEGWTVAGKIKDE